MTTRRCLAKVDVGRHGPPLPRMWLDYWPLHRVALGRLPRISASGHLVIENDGVTDGQIARLFGVALRQVVRWRASGRIRLDSADRCAVAIGLVPLEVWGWDFYASLTPENTAGGHDSDQLALLLPVGDTL